MSVESTASLEELLVHTQWLRALATRLVHDSAGAEDLVQETWIVALTRPPRANRPVRPWLARVVRNLASNRRRAERRRAEHEQAARQPDAPRPAGEIVAELEAQRAIVEALLQLREPLRETLVLRYYRGLDSSQIARRQGVPAGTVRRRLKEGIDELRTRLDARFGGSRSTWCLLLEPLVLTKLTAAGSTGAATAGALAPGVLTMSFSVKVAAAVAVLGIAGGWWWLQVQDERKGSPEGMPATAGMEAAEEGVQPPIPFQGEIGPDIDSRQAVPHQPAQAVAFALRQPDGSPASNARAAVCQGGSLVWNGIANEAGEIVVDTPTPGPATLLVLASGVAPQAQNVVLEPGQQEIRLRLGAVVSGQISVDGKTPTELFPLELHSDHPLVRVEDMGTTWEELGIDARSATTLGGRTVPDGSFHFHGLPAEWRGELKLPRHLRPRDLALSGSQPNTILLGQAIEGLSIDLVRLVQMQGRVVMKPGGTPVPRAFVRPALLYSDALSQRSYQRTEVADAEGRFQIVLLNPSIRGGSLQISGPDELLTRKIAVEPEDLTGDKDLGDLVLLEADETVAANLLVVNTEGTPIAGAVAGTDDESPVSMRTDETGRTVLRGVVPGLSVIEVHALGYQPVEVQVPLQLPDSLVVTMRRSPVLELVFRTPSGGSTFVAAILAADEYPLLGSTRCTRAYREAGASMVGRHTFVPPQSDLGVAVRFQAKDGRVVANAIKPGLPLRLSMLDWYGQLIAEGTTIAPLQEEEHRRLEITLPRDPLTLSGRVLDESGNPIAGASVSVTVYLGGKDRVQIGGSTDHLGLFSMRGITTGFIELSISKTGYVPFSDTHLEPPEDGSVLEFRLGSGRELEVTIQDEEGQRLEGSVNAKWGNDAIAFGKEIRDGVYLLRGVPDQEVIVTAWVYGAPYTLPHRPGDPEVVFTVPLLGEVSATVDLLVDDQGKVGTLVLFLVPEPDSNLAQRVERLDLHTGGWPVNCVIRGVLPGDYTAVVKRSPDPRKVWKDAVDVSLPHPVHVRAEETTHVQILH